MTDHINSRKRIPRHHAPMRLHGPARRRQQRKRQEGVVLLVVIFVLAMVTAAGGLALRSSRNQSTQAGNNRLAVQTQYLNEAVLLDALAHVELPTISPWRTQPPGPLPPNNPNLFASFGTRDLTGIETVKVLPADSLGPVALGGSRRAAAAFPVREAPLWLPPSDMVPASGDPTGTTGPRTPWSPDNAAAFGRQAMVVHFVNCRVSPARPGNAAGPGRPPGLMCTAEARARTAIAASPIRNAWNVAGQIGPYLQLSHAVERFAVGSVFIPAI